MNESTYTVQIVHAGRIVLLVGSNLTAKQANSLRESVANSATYSCLGRVVISQEV